MGNKFTRFRIVTIINPAGRYHENSKRIGRHSIRAKSSAELNEELVAAKKELFNLRFQNATNQLDNTSRIKEVRKNIARIQTVLAAKAN